MKTKNIIQRLCIFFTLVLSLPAGAQNGSGSEISISSKADWKTFRDRVNSGQTNINAKMTADIDLGEEIMMVGSQQHKYSGTFDGNGHSLTVNWNAGSESNIAPFNTVENATIKNLRVKGQITSKGNGLCGLIWNVYGTTTVSGCISEVDIKGAAILAGMIYEINRRAEVTVIDCLVKGRITATKERIAGFVFKPNGHCSLINCLYAGENNADPKKDYTFAPHRKLDKLENCYLLNPCGRHKWGQKVSAERLKSGEMTRILQANRTGTFWGQILGKNDLPEPTNDMAKHVYKVDFTHNGQVKTSRYATKGNPIFGSMPDAKEILGIDYDPRESYMLIFESDFSASTPISGDIKVAVMANMIIENMNIVTAEDWKKFCYLVNSGQKGINAKLLQNIYLGNDIAMVGNNYSGTFDGNNRTIYFDWDTNADDIALFKKVNGTTIKNLRTEGTIKSSGHYVAGLIDEAYGSNTISGCVSNVNITSTYDKSDGCGAGGMISYIGSNAHVTFKDCLVKGSINATSEKGKKGLGGFVYIKNGTCTLTNCLYAGTNNADNSNNKSYTFASGNPTLNNCYYLNACGNKQGKQATLEQLKNGEISKILQDNRTDASYWGQVLGEMPDLYREADENKINYVFYYRVYECWKCDNFRLTDEKPLSIGLDFTANKATYERTFSAGKVTVCLPYNLPVWGRFKAYKLLDVQGNGNAIYFKEVKDDELKAYRPYLLTTDGTLQLSGEHIQVKAYKTDDLKQTAGAFSFIGTVADVNNATAAAANTYILQDDGMFHKVTTEHPGATVPAYRAYVTCPKGAGAKQLSIVIDGETTGIGDVTNEATDGKNGPVYDLQGRRMADRLDDAARYRLPAGVYIVGGRKVVVK